MEYKFKEFCENDKNCPYFHKDCKVKNIKGTKCPIYAFKNSGIEPYFHKLDENGFVIQVSSVKNCKFCGSFVTITETADNPIYGNICVYCLTEFKEKGYPINRYPQKKVRNYGRKSIDFI